MRRIRFVLVAALLLLVPAANAQKLRRAQVEALDRLLSAYREKHGIPGLSTAVALNGKVIWSKGYGFADLENSVPAGPQTAYRTASMGKPMTATAAMLLVEQGKLALDQSIQQVCPAFPAKPWVITPRHLLAHMSGIRHYGGPRDREEQSSTVHYATVGAALAPFKDDPLLFEPGTQSAYSSYGYDVLGCVIEGAAGRPFLEVMQRSVFDRTGPPSTADRVPA